MATVRSRNASYFKTLATQGFFLFKNITIKSFKSKRPFV
jgi:hypothetical protein